MAIFAGNIQQVTRKEPEKPKLQQVSPRIAAKNIHVGPIDKKIRREEKQNVKITEAMKAKDKKIRAEDKRRPRTESVKSVTINTPVQSSQVRTREVLKPSRYVLDLMSN